MNDLRASQGEITSRLKEAEKKWRNLDVELQQSQEVMIRAKINHSNSLLLILNYICYHIVHISYSILLDVYNGKW